MAKVFSYHGNDLEELSRRYAVFNSREICAGDLRLNGTGRQFDVEVSKAVANPVSLMRVVSNTTTNFRRSWQHIRANKTGVRVIVFVRKGSVKILRSQNAYTVHRGECVILDSSVPYSTQTVASDGFEAVHLIVPAHLFVSRLPGAISLDHPFPVSGRSGQLICRLLNLLLEEGDSLGDNTTATLLVTALLETLGTTISDVVSDGANRRQRLVDKRRADIETYITMNLTNPDLTYDAVASHCGISPRYLCYILKANNTSFSELVWSQRLPKAREWLLAPDLRDYPIQEIAFMAGFKSAAHFSRTFKERYGCSPRAFRSNAQATARLEALTTRQQATMARERKAQATDDLS